MKKHLAFFSIILLLCATTSAQQTPLRCGNELLEKEEDYESKLLEKRLEIKNWLHQNPDKASLRETYHIPVVVHVLYTNEVERLSRQQILSQIAVLNEDFNARNNDADEIPGEFRSLKADVGFTFCLASKTPDGADTKGIVYQPTTIDCIANTFDIKSFDNRAKLYYSDEGGSDAWDTERYLNIWVGNTCGKFLGQTLSRNIDFPNEDGVVIDYKYFGSGCATYPFNLGRTTTHEVGHYFGLNHIFSGSGCDGDDGIEDTPQQANSYSGCPTYPTKPTCNSRDMFMNFMDYVDDDCMKLFTEGQKIWMVATLEMERAGLLGNDNCREADAFDNKITVFPNPAQHCIYIKLDKEITAPVSVRLFAASGRLIYESTSNGNFIKPIMVTSLPLGVYFLRLEYSGGKETRRVVLGM